MTTTATLEIETATSKPVKQWAEEREITKQMHNLIAKDAVELIAESFRDNGWRFAQEQGADSAPVAQFTLSDGRVMRCTVHVEIPSFPRQGVKLIVWQEGNIASGFVCHAVADRMRDCIKVYDMEVRSDPTQLRRHIKEMTDRIEAARLALKARQEAGK